LLALHFIHLYNETMNQAFHLYRLQQIDTQIDQAQSVIQEIDRLIAGDATVSQAAAALDAAAKELRLAQQRLKEAEFAVHEQQMKIGHSEASLYSGRLHNPKELQDIQKEVASLKKHLSALEDQQIEAMIRTETCETNHDQAQTALKKAEAGLAERSAGWLGKKDQAARVLERLSQERATIAPLISQASLKVYDNLRKRKSGVGVTVYKDGSCAVCGASIRPAELQAARTAQDLMYCGSCGRILYAG
jgi:predicted  nucleic acid-binding Zn-ribbon protein